MIKNKKLIATLLLVMFLFTSILPTTALANDSASSDIDALSSGSSTTSSTVILGDDKGEHNTAIKNDSNSNDFESENLLFSIKRSTTSSSGIQKTIEENVLYKAPITVGYQQLGYESIQMGMSGLLGSTAEIKAVGDMLTVTVTGSHIDSDYLTGLEYKNLTTDATYKEATILEKDEKGNVTKAQFTVPYTEGYIYINLKYTSAQADYDAALGIKFSEATKVETGEGEEQPETPKDPGEATHTIRFKTQWNQLISGKNITAENVIQIPNLPTDAMVTTGLFETAIGTFGEEAEVVKKDNVYTLILRMATTAMGATLSNLHLVNVDLDNIDAQTHTALTPVEKTIDGQAIYEYYIPLDSADKLNGPVFLWGTAEMSGFGTFYNPFAINIQEGYLIDLSEQKLPADGSYLVDMKIVESASAAKDALQSTEQVPVEVKNGKATIRLKMDNIYINKVAKKLTYAIYGKDTNYESNDAVAVPVSGEAANYAFIETSDLRKVIFLSNGKNTSVDSNGVKIRVDLTSLKENQSPEVFEFLENGNYTADVEILNVDGTEASTLAEYFETTKVPLKSENGKITLSLRMKKDSLDNFKQNLYGKYSDLIMTPISGTDLYMVDIVMYYKGDTAILQAEKDSTTVDFRVKLKSETIQKLESVNLLSDGEYTVDIVCLKDGSNDESMSGSYFEKENVKVKVENGKVYMTLNIRTEAEGMTNLIQGLKHKLNDKWIKDDPKTLDADVYNDGIARVTETIQIDSLEEPIYVQIYVTAMGWWATLRIIPDLNTLEGDALGAMLAVPSVATNPSTYTGMFKNEEVITVSMTTTEADAEIYYTLDGSDPEVGTAKTFQYTKPFVVKTNSDEMNTITVKAITYKNGKKSFSKSYDVIFLEKEVAPTTTATEPGVYRVPYRIWKAFEQDYSMADDAIDGDMIVQVCKDEQGKLTSNYYMTVKARNQNNIIGHLKQLWNIPGTDAPTGAPADYELTEQKATVLATVNEVGISGTNADYPKLLQFTRESSGEEFFYVRVDVDAMGDTHQSAKIVMDWALDVTDSSAFRKKKISELSGGQRQRVWLAMALAQKTDILFLDEPTTYLDIKYQIEILRLVQELNRTLGLTAVMVLHDINQAVHFSDRIVGMCDGRIVVNGAANDVITTDTMEQIYHIALSVKELEPGKKFVLAV